MSDLDFLKIITSNEVIAAIATAIIAGIFGLLQARAKLYYGYGNYFTYSVPNNQPSNPNILYHVGTIYLKNTGRATAQNVELTFNFKPQHFQIWPPIPFEEATTPDGRYVLKILFLAAKESFTINLLMAELPNSATKLPDLMHIRSADGPGKQQLLAPMPVLGKPISLFIGLIILLGVFQGIVFCVSIVKHIIASNCLL